MKNALKFINLTTNPLKIRLKPVVYEADEAGIASNPSPVAVKCNPDSWGGRTVPFFLGHSIQRWACHDLPHPFAILKKFSFRIFQVAPAHTPGHSGEQKVPNIIHSHHY
ncbi:hypothetical protein DFA_03568 [Cavenderia fasciculata]|uniref:Uncharacterized protein n=1 Tax=Cavenderia fasciculata TaxID=261658 RepID=F4PI36_CACFS|nr:uncharacterized protein DFA_03568 [Cavenderia fasciculata]EGG25319.1 hypothetical protein DFA_03568 [Cavenderia fasciculata]|eukprot:XP_004363170.1 hypothetical protein DFA_03568 [Cavenderia fasciculata]